MQQSSSPAGTASPASTRQMVGLALLSCATLLLQASWTRVLSVTMWYHFAFLVISTAMLGIGLSGVVLTVARQAIARIPTAPLLLAVALAQALSTVGGLWLSNHIPFAPFSLAEDPLQWIFGPLFMCCIAAAFFFSGLAAAILLSRHPAQAGRIYCFDLVGAGLGCALVAVVLRAGGSTAVVTAASLAVCAGLCVAPRRWLPWVGLCCGGFAVVTWQAENWLPLRISSSKRYGTLPVEMALRSPHRMFTGWNSISRVDVLPAPWGYALLIDGGTAMSRLPRVRRNPAELGPVNNEDALVLNDLKAPSVLVVGSGGGWEVLSALRQGARRVVAVEVNPLLNRLVTGRLASTVGHIFADPRVELHTDEARSFLARQAERFDVIMAAHTISNAATAAGAMSLTESYLMTVEAFRSYLQHLNPGGRLWLTRPENQLPRLAATMRRALEQHGASEPWRHVMAFASGKSGESFFGGMIASPTPLAAAWIEATRQALPQHGLRPLFLPGATSQGLPLLDNLLHSEEQAFRAAITSSSVLLDPCTDDRPFFNQRGRWSRLGLDDLKQVFRQQSRARMAVEDKPVAETVLLLVLVQSLILALLFIVLPLALGQRWGLHDSTHPLAYFFLLGIGFILVEMALLQRLTLLVGQPVHAFVIVVGSLLVFSGVGSFVSQRLGQGSTPIPHVLIYLLGLVAALLLAVSLLFPWLLSRAVALPFVLRAFVAMAVVLPLGVTMGMAFPLGLRFAGQHTPTAIPWAWGLNAVASVVGAGLATILSTIVGVTGVFVLAAAVYGSAALICLRWSPKHFRRRVA